MTRKSQIWQQKNFSFDLSWIANGTRFFMMSYVNTQIMKNCKETYCTMTFHRNSRFLSFTLSFVLLSCLSSLVFLFVFYFIHFFLPFFPPSFCFRCCALIREGPYSRWREPRFRRGGEVMLVQLITSLRQINFLSDIAQFQYYFPRWNA